MTVRSLLAVGILALSLPALADDTDDIKAQLSSFEEVFNAGDAAGVAALYTEDAIAMPPGGGMVEGREAIEAMWQGALDDGLKDLSLSPAEIEVMGDTATEVSTLTAMAGEAPYHGKYIVIWKKVDGTWLLHRDIWNDSPAE